MEEIDLKELYEYFKSKIIWVIITVLVVLVIGNIYANFIRVPMYRSSTSVVLVSENQNETYNNNDIQLNKNLVGTYTEIIKSRKVLNKVINNMGLEYKVTELTKNVSVDAIQNTEVIRISVKDKDADLATQIANEIANVFITEIQKIYNLNNVSIVDKAVKASKPYNVNYIKDNIIFIAIGLVLSSGIIFISFYFDTTIKTSEDIEKKLGLTVMGVVPKVRME